MGSVDEDEMIIFKNLAVNWWDLNGPAKGLHSLSAVTVPYIKDLLLKSGVCREEYTNTPTPLKNLAILDAGCGAGIMSEALAKLGCDVTGLDPCEDIIKVGKQHQLLNSDLTNLNYFLGEIEIFAEQNQGKFDVVVSSEVLEHITKYEQYLEACIKCLKKGGSLIVTTFNRTFLAWFGGIIMAEYVLRLVPVGSHQWKKFVALEEVERVVKKYKCEKKSVIGLLCNVFTNTWYLTKYKGISYGIHCIKE